MRQKLRVIVTRIQSFPITVRDPPQLTCLARYEKSIKRWSHLQPAAGDGGRAKMLDYIAGPETWRFVKRRAERFINILDLNHSNTNNAVWIINLCRIRFIITLWTIWITIDINLKYASILWAMVRGNCNLVWLKISPDTPFPNNNLLASVRTCTCSHRISDGTKSKWPLREWLASWRYRKYVNCCRGCRWSTTL